MKRLLLLISMLTLTLPGALAEETRYDQVFNISQDKGQFTIRFLDLGPLVSWDKPGDSMILVSPDGKTMLLDTGNSAATDYVRSALDAMGITHLDCILISHPHSDHMDGLPAIMNEYGTDIVYTSNFYHDYGLEGWDTKHIILSEGSSFKFGEFVTVNVYHPNAQITYPNTTEYYGDRFYNDHSLVLKFTFGTSTFLTAGDLYSNGEYEVMEQYGDLLDVDVLKANHHGNISSNTKRWLQNTSPRITIITNYLMSNSMIYRNYQNIGECFHTLYHGNIRISTPGNSTYSILTEYTEIRKKR